MVVEDEYYAREALIKMILEWDSNTEIIGKPQNGKEALDQIREKEPNIILSDIRMPKMDGLELCRYVKDNYEDIFLVLVSGYADFNYARSAIVIGVNDYLLKPVKKDALFTLLDNLKSRLIEREKRFREINRIKSRAESISRIQNLLSVLYGMKKPNEETLSFLFPFTELPGYRLLIAMNYIEENTLQPSLKDSFGEEYIENKCFIFHNMLSEDEWIAIIPTYSQLSQYIKNDDKDSHKRICQTLSLEKSFIIGISGLHESILSLPISYKEAKFALAFHLIQDDKFFIFHPQENADQTASLDKTMENALRTALYNQNAPLAKKIIRNFFLTQSEKGITSLHSVLVAYNRISNMLNDASVDKGDVWSTRLPVSPDISYFHTLEHLVDFMEERIEHLFSIQGTGKERGKTDDSTDAIIEDIKLYVRENYTSEISLDELARFRYFINTSYLSRVFKQKTGIGFNDFVTAVRMEKARLMVEERVFSTSDIARLVGYLNTSYFIQLFKKTYGETPGKLNTK